MKKTDNRLMTNGSKILLYAVLIFFVFIFSFPFYYVFVLASQEGTNMYTYPPHIFFNSYYLTNIIKLFEDIPFGINFLNSAGIATLATFGTAFFCTMSGFALAKYEFKGKKIIYTFMLSTIAIPTFLNIIPFFKMMIAFNWYGTWLPLIIPGLANAFGIFLMAQFLKEAVPFDLLSAARIDGLSEFGILMKVVFPLAQAGLAILMIVTFVGSWNNLLGPLIFLPQLLKTTIPVALTLLFNNLEGDRGGLMAGNTLAILPLMLVVLTFSKKIIAGLTAGSLKG
ncbi:MAG: carbohydrate ABC transporter permease [Spirochaetaceae bacterium]|nr:carbohydrate ABC transporter permease [Spirochaetaceae bacterium]